MAVYRDAVAPFRCTLQLTQHTSGGTPDAAFGTNGRVVTAVTNIHMEVNAVLLSDGSALVRGVRNNGTANVPFLAKFTSAGAPDTSFGTNGVVMLNALPVGFPLIGSTVDAAGRAEKRIRLR